VSVKLFYFQSGLNAHCRQKDQEVPMSEYMTIFVLITVILLVAYFAVRFTVKFGSWGCCWTYF